MRTETIIRLYNLSQRLRCVDSVTQNLHYASKLGWAGKILAGLSIIESVGITFVGVRAGLIPWLESRGFQRCIPDEVENFVGLNLLASDIPKVRLDVTGWNTSEKCTIVGGVAAVIQHYNEIYVVSRDYETVRRWVADSVWAKGDVDLSLDQNRDSDGNVPTRGGANTNDIVLTSLRDPGPYVAPSGGQDIGWYADRIRRFGIDNTFMFVGPSGSGKSVLSRNVARTIQPGGKVLRVSCENHVSSRCILAMAEILRPEVVLIDDLGLTSDGGEDVSAAIRDLESLRSARRNSDLLILITVMAKAGTKIQIQGIRPGRVDDVFYLPNLDEAWRRRILEHFAPDIAPAVLDEVASLTDGLSGAYLQNIAHRLHIFGTDRETIRTEIEAVRNFSPKANDQPALDSESRCS